MSAPQPPAPATGDGRAPADGTALGREAGTAREPGTAQEVRRPVTASGAAPEPLAADAPAAGGDPTDPLGEDSPRVGTGHASTVEELPRAPGHAQDLSRRRSTRRRYVDTGRRHHLGAAPAEMPVYGEDGAIVGTTRTSRHQLASLTLHQLEVLASTVATEMAAAAADLEFETARARRDEAADVAAELARRAGPAG